MTRSEPLITVGFLTALVAAVIALIVAFFPGILSEDQEAAIMGLVAVVAPAVVAIVARRYVTPNAKVSEAVAGGTVIAGPANDMLSPGTVVRNVGEMPRHPDETLIRRNDDANPSDPL